MNLARRYFEFHGITPTELAEFMPPARADNPNARRQRAWRYLRGDTEWTLSAIKAALECCRSTLGPGVTFEDVFLGSGLPKKLRKAG